MLRVVAVGIVSVICMGSSELAAETNSCPSNSRLYRSGLNGSTDPTSYQELQFVDGLTSGRVTLTEYHIGKAVWTAQGAFGCSNGVSICSVSFPLTSGELGELPYEIVDSDDATLETVVIPALRQSVAMQQNSLEADAKQYNGLAASLLGGFAPPPAEKFLGPYNVYRIAGCKD